MGQLKLRISLVNCRMSKKESSGIDLKELAAEFNRIKCELSRELEKQIREKELKKSVRREKEQREERAILNKLKQAEKKKEEARLKRQKQIMQEYNVEMNKSLQSIKANHLCAQREVLDKSFGLYARATKGGIEDRSKSSNSDTLAAHSNNSKSDCAQRNSTKKPWK
eukprot:TRINITY_DN3990_c0_g4_i1.p2 TRINITY_DN3990_c0_g4~~TRINITY_DN3990_c0_g4_i1.p2  ORF type:complete len:167 (-),score=30.60 TRINITY_DN3990_c0_g4_i1:55-555(-)